MICRKCKFSLSGSEKYCPNCGAPLHEEKEDSPSQAQPPKVPEIFFSPVKEEENNAHDIFRTEKSSEEAPPPAEKKKERAKSSSKAPVVLMLILILTVLTVGFFVAAEKLNITPAILNYLGSGAKTETDSTHQVYSPEESLIPSPVSGTVTPDINYTSTEAYVARINLLSLRKGPSDAYGLITSLEAGTQLQITGGTAVTDSWIYVYVPSEDCYGWVNAAFVSLYTYTETDRVHEKTDYIHTSEKSVVS